MYREAGLDRQNRQRRRKKSFLKTFLATFVVLLVLATTLFFVIDKYSFFGLFGGNIAKDIKPLAGKDTTLPDADRINVLILGGDQTGDKGLTDTIMLASFDIKKKLVDIISVPRDTYYDRSQYEEPAFQKINSVYETEDFAGIITAVSKVLGGVPIHFYAFIADSGVRNIVNAMGGVQYYVPQEMYYVDESQGLYIDLQPGDQLLNGDQAVQFLRFRSGYANADLGRVDAQQGFVKAALKQVIGPNVLDVVKVALDEVVTNITLKQAIRLSTEALGIDTEKIASYVAPGEPETVNGTSYFFVDPAAAQQMMEAIYAKGNEKTQSQQ